MWQQIQSDARQWCSNRNGWLRLPFLVWFAYVLLRHLTDQDYGSILAPLNLGIHELGHAVLSPLGEFIGILGGTLFQVAAPVAGMINFYRQADFFSIALCFGWLSTSLFGVAAYVADARSQSMPLVSPWGSDDVIHDWNYLLGHTGLLAHDVGISFLIRCSAVVSMAVCLAAGTWLVVHMVQARTTDGEAGE